MGLISRIGKKELLKLPDIKLMSLAREIMPYVSIQSDDLKFFFSNTDHAILNEMIVQKKIWSKDAMDYVLGYFGSISSRPGAVLDIGANVGTSVIYFRHKLGGDCMFYAVEPVSDNYDLLNANCAINGYYDIKTFKCGVSETSGEAKMDINPDNMGNCKIAGSDSTKLVQGKDDVTYVGETVTLDTLDSFFRRNGIGTDSPVLFWIDVEGHEPEVFRSGKDTFKKTDSAVFIEFNPKLYKYNGKYDGFINDMKECFGRFICFEQARSGSYNFRDISEIDMVAEENGMEQCNLLLVKKAP